MVAPIIMNTTGTSHLPERSTREMIFLCDPSHEAAAHQSPTRTANTATVVSVVAAPSG